MRDKHRTPLVLMGMGAFAIGIAFAGCSSMGSSSSGPTEPSAGGLAIRSISPTGALAGTFDLYLSDPTNATLGTAGGETVTVHDDDGSSPTQPPWR